MLYNLGAKKLSKVAVFSLRLLLGQLLVLSLPWLVVLNNTMRLEGNLYIFILNFATVLPFLQVCRSCVLPEVFATLNSSK